MTEGLSPLESQQVGVWRAVFDSTYSRSPGAELDDDFGEWTDSSGRDAIPVPEMIEWADDAAASIVALSPRCLLEVGSGIGLMLRRLAAHCDYTGTDVSPVALSKAAAAAGGRDISLRLLAGHEIGLLDGLFDTVVMNSVIQYFPSTDYLSAVLDAAINKIDGRGHVFVGDVRHVDLLAAEALDGLLIARGEDESSRSLRRRLRGQLQGNELALSPTYFERLGPRVTNVRIRPKQTSARTVMTRFRYDVVVSVGGGDPVEPNDWLDWSSLGGVAALTELVARAGDATDGAILAVRRVPNARTLGLRIASQAVSDHDDRTVGELRGIVDAATARAVWPETIRDLAAGFGLRAELSWRSGDADGAFDVAFVPRAFDGEIAFPGAGRTSTGNVATDPLRMLRRMRSDASAGVATTEEVSE